MKKLMLGLTLMGFAGSALALDSAGLDARIQNLTALFQAMQDKPSVAVPADVLRDAKGIVLMDIGKGGFGFAYQHGAGVAMVRDSATGKWSAPAFLEANGASFGPQAGGAQAFVVIVLTTSDSTHALTQPNFAPGGEAGGTAGYSGGSVQSKGAPVEKGSLFYADRNGFFGGAAVKFGGMSPDGNANTLYYNQSISMSDILFNQKVPPTQAAQDLIKAITDRSKVPKSSQ